jgi:perosamine synthetase
MKVPAARTVFTETDQSAISEKLIEILANGRLTLGSNTKAFEDAFAAAHEMPYAVAVSSGTAALEIILRSIGVEGYDVIVPTNTFPATAFAVLRAGGRIVLSDIDEGTFSLSAEALLHALTSNTAVVVIVHIGGRISPEISQIRQICDERGILLVEDAAHAHGSQLGRTYAGDFGVAGAFSFYPTKVITAGEGGMILTRDPNLRDEAILYRDQGKAAFSTDKTIREGYAWRMTEINAAVGLVQTQHLRHFIEVRRGLAAR